MSGGVDSCVAAALLREQGCDVIGVTAVMSGEQSRCCSEEDVRTAQRVTDQLGIAHHVVDVREPFERLIIDYFVSECVSGRTPSPCARCNSLIKFGILMKAARDLGAGRLATGHYARVRRNEDGFPELLRGVDHAKDQSYFLSGLASGQLEQCVFPLGESVKEAITRYARSKDLACRASKESQELCFISEVDHGAWIDVRSFDTKGPGDIVDTDGRKVGEHRGIHHYTVGQRRGLGLAVGRPLYVAALDAERNVVVVGDRTEAFGTSMRVKEINWICGDPPASPFRADTQIRYNHKAAASDISLLDDGAALVRFDEPQFALTPGQVAAFYDGDRVIAGGWIDSTSP